MKTDALLKNAQADMECAQKVEQQTFAAKTNIDKQMQLYKLVCEKVAASTEVAEALPSYSENAKGHLVKKIRGKR